MTTYTVSCRHSGDWWALEVVGVPGAFSQCSTLTDAAPMIDDVLDLMIQPAPDLIRLIGPEVADALSDGTEAVTTPAGHWSFTAEDGALVCRRRDPVD